MAATESLAGANTALSLCMGMGTVVRAGVAGRRAAGGRFGRRFGLGRRWHDDFYLCSIGVEDILGLKTGSGESAERNRDTFVFFDRTH